MFQSRAIDLGENIGPDPNLVVRADPEDVNVVGGMVDFAHCDAVGDDGRPAFRVGQDMGGVEQSGMAEPADGALVRVGGEDTLAEERLMEASGMNDPDYKYGGKFKIVSTEEFARIFNS